MKKRLLISTVLYNVHPIVYSSHLDMFYRVGKNLPDYDVIFYSPNRVPIDSARNAAVRYALDEECDYLFFYDDDMFLHPDVVQRLLNRMDEDKVHVVMARCYIRGYPYDPMIFKYKTIRAKGKKGDDEEVKTMVHFVDYKKYVRKDGLVKVDAVGCASTMIDMELFKLMPEPWFLTGSTHTEDVYFCIKAINYVENVGIFMDDTFESGHLMNRPLLTAQSRQVLTKLTKEGLNDIFLPQRDKDKEKEQRKLDQSNPLLEEKKKDGKKNTNSN